MKINNSYKFILTGGLLAYLISVFFYAFLSLYFENTADTIFGTVTKNYSITDLRLNHFLEAIILSVNWWESDFLLLTSVIVAGGGILGFFTFWLVKKFKVNDKFR